MIHLKFDNHHTSTIFLIINLLIIERTSWAIASNWYIFANDFALLPFMVAGEDFGNTDIWWSFLFKIFGWDVVLVIVWWLIAKEI